MESLQGNTRFKKIHAETYGISQQTKSMYLEVLEIQSSQQTELSMWLLQSL